MRKAKNTKKGGDLEYKVLTDIQGPEDHHGDMDFKVAGTRNGITAVQMDVKVGGIPLKILSEAFEKVGDQIDLVIIAVGLLGKQMDDQDSASASADLITVNVTWPVAALAEIRGRLIDQGSGRILVMSSVAAIRVRENAYLYSGAKAGLDRVCVGLAQSLEGTGVKLQLLRPAFVRTKMTVGAAEPPFTTGANEVAENVMRGLASNDDVIWSPPILRYVSFIIRHLPTPIWRKVANR